VGPKQEAPRWRQNYLSASSTYDHDAHEPQFVRKPISILVQEVEVLSVPLRLMWSQQKPKFDGHSYLASRSFWIFAEAMFI
jgi:hypothetical protein